MDSKYNNIIMKYNNIIMAEPGLRTFQIFEDNNETINNICKSNAQKVNN